MKYVWAQELQYAMCPVSLQAKPYDSPIHPNTRWPVYAQQNIIFEPIWKDETEIVLIDISYAVKSRFLPTLIFSILFGAFLICTP